MKDTVAIQQERGHKDDYVCFVLQVFCDNYLDGGYHVPFAHKDLASGLKLDSYSTTVWSLPFFYYYSTIQ